MPTVFHYAFDESVDPSEIEATLVLSLVAVESLHGAAQTRLDARHQIDLERRTCTIDASTQVGRNLNRIFVGLLQKEYDERAFDIKRIEGESLAPTTFAA